MSQSVINTTIKKREKANTTPFLEQVIITILILKYSQAIHLTLPRLN